MNIFVDLFGCFSLLVLASSLRIKESKSRGIQAPIIRKGPHADTSENPARNREVAEKDDEYNHAISNYENFRLVHDVPEVSELSRDRLHNTSEMKQDIKGIFPYQNSGVTINIEPFISRVRPHSFPGQKEESDIKFNNLLCLTDCRMADLMMFNFKNQPGNISFQNMALAGRPYTFASLKKWCKDNCGKRPGRTNSNSNNDAFEGKETETENSNENEDIQFEDEKPAVPNTDIPYISFGAKPPRLIPPIPPVIPTIFLPSVRNFYPYPNIIAAPFLYSARNGRRTSNTGQTSGVSFRSLRDNFPKSVSRAESHPYHGHQWPKFRGQSYPGLVEYNALRDSRKLKSDTEKGGKERQHQQTDDVTEKTTEKPKYDEDDDSYEDAYYEDDDDVDDEEEERIDSVVRFLREVSRILSNKAFRVLLKRSSSCDSKREVLPGKEQNSTDSHGRGLH